MPSGLKPKVARVINTVAFSRRCISTRYVARRLNTTTVFALLAPGGPGASTASVRHRIYESDHKATANAWKEEAVGYLKGDLWYEGRESFRAHRPPVIGDRQGERARVYIL